MRHPAFILTCCALATVALSREPAAASVALACTPAIGPVQIVASAPQRAVAARDATPSLVDIFAWPDGPLGVLRDGPHLRFFATDGGRHRNGKAGSVTETIGELADPLGIARARFAPQPIDVRRDGPPPNILARPLDVTIAPDLALDPLYPQYGYIGGGPVYRVPAKLPGAGDLLTVFHTERPVTGAGGIYSSLGLARSLDDGRSWLDVGEIVEPNQPYRRDLQGFDIGVSQLTVDPTGAYAYVYYPDWIANGTVAPTTVTGLSVARVALRPLLVAAFAPRPRALPRFEKFYRGAWNQPGINGLATDLQPADGPGPAQVDYDAYLRRYVSISLVGNAVTYSESPDGLAWSGKRALFTDASGNGLYPRAIGTGVDPNVLGRSFFVYFTERGDWSTATLRRFAVTCT